ncbi:hypothetical protein ncot_11515 [Nocardioides sp. JQ2195]|uniref:hypothetical protein n=1 Tax=Nocardioides sp. JQ2195 TaxID=2592334 RepID=UPI00143ED7EA|nr:hypothetical protein [Nocardioides sp. JQ2195]QIX27155.1 hypothetical protein ncot_11515 [Nocardioides sp. JQ2195]
MLTIEEDRGTYTGRLHPHNGYYAGDFSRRSKNGATGRSAMTGSGLGTRTATWGSAPSDPAA